MDVFDMIEKSKIFFIYHSIWNEMKVDGNWEMNYTIYEIVEIILIFYY